MTTMTCDVFTDRLMAYLENETDDATRVAMERHAAGCGECGALLADLRKIRSDAANLPALAPSRDLWSGIATRIEATVVPIAAGGATRTQRVWSRTSVKVALFAASLLAAAGIGYLSAGPRVPGAPGDPESAGPAIAVIPDPAPASLATVAAMAEDSAARAATGVVRQPAAQGARGTPASAGPLPAQLAVATLTADYDREVARLRLLIEERRNQLDPATVAVIEKNIQVIDAAILDSKKAIAADPSSAFLIESLNQSLRTKVELMRTAAALPIRM